MKNILISIVLLFLLFNASTSPATAEILRVDNARVQTLWVYNQKFRPNDQMFKPNSFVVFFNKTAGNCQGAWVDTTKSYAEYSFQVFLSAFESQAQVNYQMDDESPWREQEIPLRCELIYVALKP